MPKFVQYGKVGKPIIYNTLPTASEDLKGVCGQVEDKIYICDGSNWNLYSSTTLKKLLDATQKASYLFVGYTGNSVDNLIAYDDTANVKDFEAMFRISQVTTIPKLNTSNATDMNTMIYSCQNITTIPLFDTSKVQTMRSMFFECTKLTTIPLLDTSNVTDMFQIFRYCEKLVTIPALDVSKNMNFTNAFDGCTSLKSILMTGMKVSFDISSSIKFERADLVTILNNLATVTSTKTLTMGATNLAKLTEEDKAIATNKGWTLA